MIITLAAGLAGGRSRSLILTAMIFAVAMTFIDQTIVSIAAPTIQRALGLSSSGMQWVINACAAPSRMVLPAAANRRRLPRSLDRGSTWCR